MTILIVMVNDQVSKLNDRRRTTFASAFEMLVQWALDRISLLTGVVVLQATGFEEGVSFAFPKELPRRTGAWDFARP
ncbi:MAG: hypothetical protein J0M01_11435 [Dechloromonas sp.]|jgi:hypothetical protein|nr:hypothetical protein [Dechloromonas sp.]